MMPKPSISESIWRRARAIAEIATIRDDMDLRHGHGDAAGDAGDAEHHLQRRRERPRSAREARRGKACPAACHRRAPPHEPGERQHCQGAENADADMRRPPAIDLDEMLQRWRPDGARDVIAGGADCDGDAAAALNQCEMSAISGPKLAALPKPISPPCASAKIVRLGAKPAAT